jgi:hypothetical protein
MLCLISMFINSPYLHAHLLYWYLSTTTEKILFIYQVLDKGTSTPLEP